MTQDIQETLEERNATHGCFKQQAKCSQALKKCMTEYVNLSKVELTCSQIEALAMISVKISRILMGNPNHADSWHDIAGYASLIVKELESTNVAEQ